MATNLAQVVLPPTPADLDCSYTPEMLLNVSFPGSITSHKEFALGCDWGFQAYFEELIGIDESGEEVFTRLGYTWEEVLGYVEEGINDPGSCGVLLSLAWKAGFCLGWLSALYRFQPSEATRGVRVLRSWVWGNPFGRAVGRSVGGRIVGSDGWPLDM